MRKDRPVRLMLLLLMMAVTLACTLEAGLCSQNCLCTSQRDDRCDSPQDMARNHRVRSGSCISSTSSRPSWTAVCSLYTGFSRIESGGCRFIREKERSCREPASAMLRPLRAPPSALA